MSEAGIVATRIEVVEDVEDMLSGPKNQLERYANFASQNQELDTVDENEFVSLNGTYKSGFFSVSSLDRGLFVGTEPNLMMAEGYFSMPDRNGESQFIGIGARSSANEQISRDHGSKSTRCSYNGRTDFVFDEIPLPERETVLALCSNLPR